MQTNRFWLRTDSRPNGLAFYATEDNLCQGYWGKSVEFIQRMFRVGYYRKSDNKANLLLFNRNNRKQHVLSVLCEFDSAD